MDRNSSGHNGMESENNGLYRTARFFFVEDNMEDVEFGTNPLGLPAGSFARNSMKSLNAVSLHSMVPEDDSETESSSSSSSINNNNNNNNNSGGVNNVNIPSGGQLQGNEGTDTVLSSLKSDDACNKGKEKKRGADSGERPLNPLQLSSVVIAAEEEKNKGGDDFIPVTSGSNGNYSQVGKATIWNTSRVFIRVLSFCNCSDLCNVMLVCKRFYYHATRDKLWKSILNRMNLQPLLSMPESPTQDYYQYFIEQIITTKAIHGHYFFTAAIPLEESLGFGSFNQIVRGKSKWGSDDEYDDDGKGISVFSLYSPTTHDASIYTVETITLRLSPAGLGQLNHSIGRVQMLIGYKDKVSEIIQGAARFSWRRKCFLFCCSSFGASLRGPVFTVAINTVQKPWPNQSVEQFNSHKGGLRFIMTPALLEGNATESRINETDVLSVSRAMIHHTPDEQDEVSQT
ncbi:F-box domain [Trypanosoma melophagium]|uniref:F-box domain n=1 Tax=Trypanosoma melophagium TaxID=715481 RepID=UPI00351A1B80|nr:F-box domain [Trypanosoma melophagium]